MPSWMNDEMMKLGRQLLGETETEENEIEYSFYFIHSFNMNNQYYIIHI